MNYDPEGTVFNPEPPNAPRDILSRVVNAALLNQYVEFMANRRMKSIGLTPPYEQSTRNNPLPWTEHWLNSRGLQNAPQETEIESYVVGGIKQDVETNSFKGFQL